MTSVRIFDFSGSLVLTFGNLAPNTLSSEFAQFNLNVFGSGDPTFGGPGPDGTAARSHLMSGNDVRTGDSRSGPLRWRSSLPNPSSTFACRG